MKIFMLSNIHNKYTAILFSFLIILMPLLERKYFILSQLLSQVAILSAVLVVLLFKQSRQISISLGMIELSFSLLVPAYLLSALAQNNKYQVLLIFYDIFIYWVLLILMKGVLLKGNFDLIFLPVIIGGDILSIIAIINKYNLLKCVGFLNYNLSAIYIFVALLACIFYIIKKDIDSGRERVMCYLSLVLMLISEIILSSRSIYFVSIIIALILMLKALFTKRARSRLIIIFCLIMLVSILALIGRFSSVPYKWERLKIWANSLVMLRDNWLFGVGPGNYHLAAYKYNFATYESVARFALYPNHAHNQWLNIVCETGVISIGILSFFLFSIAIGFFNFLKRDASPSFACLAFVSLLLFGFFNNFFDSYALSFLFIVLLVMFQMEIKGKELTFCMNKTKSTISILAVLIVFCIIFYSILPYCAYIYYQKSLNLLNKKDMVNAKRSIENAIKLVPTFSLYYQTKAMIEFQEFQNRKEINILPLIIHTYEVAGNLNPNDFNIKRDKATFYLFLASFFKTKEFIYSAISCYLSAIENNPYNPFYHLYLSESYVALKDYEDAIEELKRAIELEPNYINAYFKLADLYKYKKDEYRSALFLERGIELARKYKDRQKSNNEYINSLLYISEEYKKMIE